MSTAEHIKITLERSQAGHRGSTAWQLGMPVRPYVWRRNDPERDAKIAAERAESAQKSAAAKARFAREKAS